VSDVDEKAGQAPWIAPWIEGLVLAAPVLAILAFGGDAARASYHGYLHDAVGEAVLRGGLVPENPYHAGAPLRYYTLYPLLGAAIGRVGIGPLWAFALIDVLAALLLPPAFDALGRAFGLSFRARRCAFLAAALGFNGLGWIGFLVAHGPGRGVPPVYALSPMTFAAEPFGWDARLQAFLPKFLNVTSYAIALPPALLALALCARGRRSLVAVAVLLALSLALNPLVGGLAGLCAAIWLAPEAWRGGWSTRFRAAVALAAAAALALPFLVPALARAPSGPSLTGKVALGGSPWPNLLGPIALLLPLGVAGLRTFPRTARTQFLCAAAFAAVLVLLGEMPQGNEYKMSRLSGLLWALPAGAFAARLSLSGGATRFVPAALALLCVPTTVAVPWAYFGWSARAPALPLETEGGTLVPRSREMRPLFEAEVRADRRAVVLVAAEFPGAQAGEALVQGNALAPALHHPLFVDLPQIHNEKLPDLAERLDVLDDVFEGRAGAIERARSIVGGRPLLVLAEDRGEEPARSLARAGAARVASGGGASLWSLPAE
jgi:hypothetical protein